MMIDLTHCECAGVAPTPGQSCFRYLLWQGDEYLNNSSINAESGLLRLF